METRVCRKCGEVRPADDFHVNYTWCNSCAGFESQYPLRNNLSDISTYTGRKSKIVARWNNKVRLFDLLLAENRKRDAHIEYVYILYCYKTKAHKIGYTSSFVRRYQSLCQSIGCHLDLKYAIKLCPSIDEPAYFIEEFMKDYFAKKKIRNEWFKLNKSDLNEIEDLFYNIEGEDVYTESLPFLIRDYRYKNGGRLMQIG